MTTEPQAPAASRYPDDLRDLVEAYLDTLQFSAIPDTAGIEEAMRYSLLAGGKRIRPVLALATARATDRDPGAVLPLAAASSAAAAITRSGSPCCRVSRCLNASA